MGQTSPIFDTAKQQGVSVGKSYGACIEHAVNWIRPVVLRKNRIRRTAGE